MADPTVPWGIPLFDDDDPFAPVQAPLNAQSAALNDALNSIAGDTGWIAPTLGAGWSNSSDGDPIMYRRFRGIVHLRGRGSTTGVSASAFRLPTGFRPTFTGYWLAERFGSSIRMNVNSIGDVNQTSPDAETIISFFSCPPFIAEQ